MNNIQDINISKVIDSMIDDLSAYLKHHSINDPIIVGIQRGGIILAKTIHQGLHNKEPLGELNISFYRDDFTRVGLHPEISPSKLPFSLENRHIILVDDVLYTGRTIRAAMNELFDYGRPASIILAIAIDRGGKELPIQAQITGIQLTVDTQYNINLIYNEHPQLKMVKKT